MKTSWNLFLTVILIVLFKTATDLPQEVQQQTHVPDALPSFSSFPSNCSTDFAPGAVVKCFVRQVASALNHPSQKPLLVSDEETDTQRSNLPKVIR